MLTRVYIAIVEALIIFGLTVMVALTFASTVYRFAGYGGIFWAEEVTRYVSIWVVFLGAGLGIRFGIHLSLEIFIERLIPPLRRVAHIIIYLLMIVFELVLLYYGAELAISNYAQQSASLQMPMTYANAAVPVGAAIMLFETIRQIVLEIQGKAKRSTFLD